MQEKNLEMYALYTSLWRNTTSIYKILHKKLEQELIVRNSSLLEYRILKIIDEVEMITMAQIAERNYVTQAWITGMIDKMEGHNWSCGPHSLWDLPFYFKSLANFSLFFIRLSFMVPRRLFRCSISLRSMNEKFS